MAVCYSRSDAGREVHLQSTSRTHSLDAFLLSTRHIQDWDVSAIGRTGNRGKPDRVQCTYLTLTFPAVKQCESFKDKFLSLQAAQIRIEETARGILKTLVAGQKRNRALPSSRSGSSRSLTVRSPASVRSASFPSLPKIPQMGSNINLTRVGELHEECFTPELEGKAVIETRRNPRTRKERSGRTDFEPESGSDRTDSEEESFISYYLEPRVGQDDS